MSEHERLNTSEPLILIRINDFYGWILSEDRIKSDIDMYDAVLYEATRKWWRVGVRRELARYAVATYRGETLEAYEIDEWYQMPEKSDGKPRRWAFRGTRAESAIRGKLVNKSVKYLFKRGNQNPIFYLNC